MVERVLTTDGMPPASFFLAAAGDILTKVAADQKPGGVKLRHPRAKLRKLFVSVG
jgi:hypothetical protein